MDRRRRTFSHTGPFRSSIGRPITPGGDAAGLIVGCALPSKSPTSFGGMGRPTDERTPVTLVAADADTGTNEPSEVPERFVVRASDPDALAARCQNRFPVFNPATGDLPAKVPDESCGCCQGEISAVTTGRLHFPPSSATGTPSSSNIVIGTRLTCSCGFLRPARTSPTWNTPWSMPPSPTTAKAQKGDSEPSHRPSKGGMATKILALPTRSATLSTSACCPASLRYRRRAAAH